MAPYTEKPRQLDFYQWTGDNITDVINGLKASGGYFASAIYGAVKPASPTASPLIITSEAHGTNGWGAVPLNSYVAWVPGWAPAGDSRITALPLIVLTATELAAKWQGFPED